MVKQTRYERAQKALEAAWEGQQVRLSYHNSSYHKIRKDCEALWNALLRVAKRYGIQVVWKESGWDDERRYHDGSGNYTAAGWYQPGPRKIALRRPAHVKTLAHEVGHGLDHALGGDLSETVAEGVACIVCGVAYRGWHFNASYVKKQGGRLTDDERERIAIISEEILAEIA